MRAQRRAGRRSAYIKTHLAEFVKHPEQLASAVLNQYHERILVGIDEHGVPFGTDRAATVRGLRHRTRVGVACGVRPTGTLPSAEWVASIRALGLNTVEYVAGENMAQARTTNGLELYTHTLRALYRDHKIDCVLLVCPTISVEPLARAIHRAGLPLVIADMSERLGKCSRVADGVLAIDSFVVEERAR